ncbi:hypothetical protein [Streptomyces hyaluromycini]|uniref:hypothetical protein n=1 Tax=Streptomyces hyaluromycini TaxID=1377993 RepID=UPI00142D3740|nr:hypothetical protein [Streptomyces hyaluromycini]
MRSGHQHVHRLPAAAAEPIIQAYADTIHTVFLWTVPVAAVGFVVALFLKQVQLRDSARLGSTDMGEEFASPHGPDSLKDRVQQDLGRPSGADLRAAVDTIGKRLLVEDLTDGLSEQTADLTPAARTV